MSSFKTPALQELMDQQVRFAPPGRRLEQVQRAQQLLAEVEPDRCYPYQFVCFRITDYRPDSYADLLIAGRDLQHDLGQLITQLARSLPPVPVESVPEPMLTLEQISKQFNVSTKTISRWRRHGLVATPVLRDGRRQLGFSQSVVERFVADNAARVERGSRFSQLSDEEREDILRRARRLSRLAGGTLTEVSRRIARRLNRSPETVRYTIKNHDRDHPEQALFPATSGPLDDQAKQVLYSSYRRGIPVDTLAKRFRRTRTSVYRAIHEVRAQRLLDQPLEYLYHPSFDDPAIAGEILGPMPDEEAFQGQRLRMHAPKDVPPELAPLYEMPLLTREQEAHLFRKMNYLKYHAAQLRGEIEPARAGIEQIEQVEHLLAEAAKVKDLLLRCNMRLVVSIAKRHSGQAENFFELLSDGNLSLIRAVEKFDYSRGNKFSTYASWALMKNFSRSIPEERRRRERYVTGHEEFFDAKADVRGNEQEYVASQEQTKHRVNRLLQYLEPREQQIVRMRAGLDSHEGMTLEEIGHELGITKERVRQLNVRIMAKLRTIAKEQKLDLA